MNLFAAFCLFVRTLPIHFALPGRKRKYIKSKTTVKLKEKRTSIATVRDILRMFDTFPNPLFSRCRLPLKLSGRAILCTITFTAKTKCRKFETNIPRKGISGPQSQFPHSCVCERIIYSHDGSACSAGAKKV
jgi:hypothetical protein